MLNIFFLLSIIYLQYLCDKYKKNYKLLNSWINKCEISYEFWTFELFCLGNKTLRNCSLTFHYFERLFYSQFVTHVEQIEAQLSRTAL